MFLFVLCSPFLSITFVGKRLFSGEVTHLPRLKRHNIPTQPEKDSFVCQTIPNPAVRQKYLSAPTTATTYQISNNEL